MTAFALLIFNYGGSSNNTSVMFLHECDNLKKATPVGRYCLLNSATLPSICSVKWSGLYIVLPPYLPYFAPLAILLCKEYPDAFTLYLKA